MSHNFDHKTIFPYIHNRIPEVPANAADRFVAVVNQHIKRIAKRFIFFKVQLNGVNEFNNFIG